MSENLRIKFKHFETQSAFEEQLNANEILNTDVCFIKESSKIYTHGQYYAGSEGGSIDTELLEDFIPLCRDFSDDFNNDFAR